MKKNNIKNPLTETRMNKLTDTIDTQIKRITNNENTDLLEIIHLFYDEI